MTDKQLNDILVHFYINTRRTNGEKYKAASMENYRHSLNRYLQTPPIERKIDIIKDPAFREANISYKAAIKELKQEGKGYVKHYPIISDSDLQKMYQSMYFDISTPCGLQNKVQLDIRLYFCRRGAENMHSMNKDTFVVQTGADGTRYVCQAVDELTKNHRENDKEATSGFMPEIPNSNLCPVKSFVSYTSKLNSSNNKLWQKPKDSFCSEENVWFCNIAVGQRSLSNFMTKMSAICELSTKYTNHSVRATGATLLSRSMFNPAQIMAVTGHKSVSSLAVYQRVSSSEKVAMGQAISRCIDKSTSVPVHQSQSSVTITENDSDDELFQNIDLRNLTSSSDISGRLLPTLFQNCQINNLTINISNKN
ncbi:uncharacterized protein [Clytia hemisphaerica]|uniref:uncharacterized protein n=1 Tax=Clytia hemisphaerica TaxID=252671 RepID=UPI0034D75613